MKSKLKNIAKIFLSQFAGYAPHGFLVFYLFVFSRGQFYIYSIDKISMDYHAQIAMLGIPIALITIYKKYQIIRAENYLKGALLAVFLTIIWFFLEKKIIAREIYFGVAGICAASYFRAYLTSRKMESYRLKYELASLIIFVAVVIYFEGRQINTILAYFTYALTSLLCAMQLRNCEKNKRINKAKIKLKLIFKHSVSNWLSSMAYILPFKYITEYAEKMPLYSEGHKKIAIFLTVMPLLLLPLNAMTQYMIVNMNAGIFQKKIDRVEYVFLISILIFCFLSLALEGNSIIFLIGLGLPVLYYKLKYLKMQINGDEMGMLIFPIVALFLVVLNNYFGLASIKFKLVTFLPYVIGYLMYLIVKVKLIEKS